MAYVYSLIRFVPDPAKGEFVNIGAIAGSDEANDWAVRHVENFRRATALDIGRSLRAAKAFTAELDERVAATEQFAVDDTSPMSAEALTRFSGELGNIVQLTPPAPVAAQSAEAALDLVFSELVVDLARTEFRFARKNQAQASVRSAYRELGLLAGSVSERAEVRSGPFRSNFDFAVHNGRALQLVQCWSFELPGQADLSEEVRAWAWLVHEIRKDGGSLLFADQELEVSRELDIAAVFIPPRPDQADASAFEEAQAIFDENDVEAAEPDAAELVAERAAHVLAASH